MPATKLTIVPVRLNPIHDNLPSTEISAQSLVPTCMINAAGVEISFCNGVDERIIQVIMRELNNR